MPTAAKRMAAAPPCRLKFFLRRMRQALLPGRRQGNAGLIQPEAELLKDIGLSRSDLIALGAGHLFTDSTRRQR